MKFHCNCFFRISLFAFLFFTFVPIQAKSDDDIKITGTFNENFIDFLNETGKAHNIIFYYQANWFTSKIVNKTYDNASILSILDELLRDSPYKFVFIQPNIIVFLPKDEVLNVISKSSFQSSESDSNIQIIGKLEDIGKVKKPEIKGTIIDGKTGEPIIGATISVQNTTLGSASDVKGNYALSLVPGIYNLVVSSIGYESKTFIVKLIGNGVMNAELFDQSIKLDEVIVSAQKADKNVKSNQMSLVELDKKALKQIPALFGERDIIKSMTMMPGVSSVGEFGSGINVRGGSSDQNLFLIEGAPIFNSSHVFGLISAINPDDVNNVSLYKGYIPQNFGERISSVMDIQLKEGSYKDLHASGGIGILDSRLMVESPIVKDKASIIISARSSYSDWLLKQIPDQDLRNSSANFFDINSMVSINAGTKNKITIFGYVSNDLFRYSDQLKYSYANYLGSFTWDHKFTDSFNSKLIFATSHYGITKDAIDPKYEINRVNTGIHYNSIKIDFNNSTIKTHTINFGSQVIYYSNNPGIQTPLDNSPTNLYLKLNNEQAAEGLLFIGDKYDITEKISFQVGLRASVYTFLGPNKINQYQPNLSKSTNTFAGVKNYGTGSIIKTYSDLEPRAALKIQLAETNSLKLSYNRNVQYLSLISYTSIPTPDDVWKLSSPYLQPTRCDQLAFGFFQNFNNNAIETSVEVYYKKLTNLIEYKNGLKISMDTLLDAGFINANGKNYGVELLLKKNKGEVDGWISYTYSRSLKQTTGVFNDEKINDNNWYPSVFDRPHNLTIMGTYHYNRRIRIAFTYNYATGRPVTYPEQVYTLNGSPFVQYSDRNKYRLPDYKRLDLSISLDETLYRKRKWKGSWSFSVINVLSNQNIYSVIYKQVSAYNSELFKLLIINQPLPTLTYNFIF